jgi:hypothetical protein
MAWLQAGTELKDIWRLVGCVTSLSRFISRLGEKALPLYRLLKQTSGFKWTPEASMALEEIKMLLATNPVLAAPYPSEPMFMYISASVVQVVSDVQVVSVVLVVEREMEGNKLKVQRPVYYISEVLTPCKMRYPH